MAEKKKAKTKSRVNEAGNYTKPTMRKRLFNKIKEGTKGGKKGQGSGRKAQKLERENKAGTKGGKKGQWSGRKGQMLAREYTAAGGGYR